MKLINKILEYKKWYPILILFFIWIYVLNFPLQYFLWWDATAVFLNPSFYYNTYTWNDATLLWWVANRTIYIWYTLYIFLLESSISMFWILWWQYVYNGFIYLFWVLLFYHWIEYFLKQKKYALLITVFFFFHFISWWVVAHRGLIFISLCYFSAPIVWRYLVQNTESKLRYIKLLLLWIVLLPIMTNPGYFVPWVIFWILFLIYYGKITNSWKQYRNKMVVGILVFIIPFISSICSYWIFFKHNNAIQQDTWNTKILIQRNLESEQESNKLSETFRWHHASLKGYWWYDQSNLDEREFYYTFPGKDAYEHPVFFFISWIPVLILIFGFTLIQNPIYIKRYLYWFIVFLFALFWYKSSAEPLWQVYVWLVNNIWLFWMFRSPHLKFGSLFLLSFIFLFIILFNYLEEHKGYKKQKILSYLIIIYIVFFGYYWLIWKAIPTIKLVENIPDTYIESSDYLKTNGSEKAILAPFNYSTWTNTEFWYEWYSFFYTLLPEIGIWNRNDGAFSTYSKNVTSWIWRTLSRNSWPLLDNLKQLNIDTIIYDWYTDRYPRFRRVETHEKNIEFLQQSWMIRERQFWKISIWRTPKELITPNLYSQSGSLIKSEKINPTKYLLEFDSSDIKQDKLILLQSYHPEWVMYKARDINTDNSWISRLSDIIYLFQTPLYKDTHDIEKNYANSWNITNTSSINNIVLYFKPQLYFYLSLLISILLSSLVFISWIYYFFTSKKWKR